MIRLFYIYFALQNIYNPLDLRRWWRVKSRYFLTRQRFEQITNEHMSNYQFLKYSLLGMKLWSMGGTLQTAHSTSTSSLGTHSLSRGGERTLCRFTLSLKFCTFLQTSSTVHRLCEGKEELLNVSNQAFATLSLTGMWPSWMSWITCSMVTQRRKMGWFCHRSRNNDIAC